MDDRSPIWENRAIGTRTYFHYDRGTDEIILNTVQNCDAVLDYNKKALNNAQGMRWGDGKLIAQIPLIFIYKMIKDGVLSPQWHVLNDSAWRRFLNDPDYRDFRTFPGRV